MKIDKNPNVSADSQKELIIQKQIDQLQKEISGWISKESIQWEEKKKILLRTNTESNFIYQTIIEKSEVRAVDSRLKFISLTSQKLQRLSELQPNETTFQKQTLMLKKVLVYLDILYHISKRLFVISKSNLLGKQVELQLEVDSLIREVDRIASQAEFNHMRLFAGDFAKDSRVASLWMIHQSNGELFRVWIATMTSKSLGLTSFDGNYLTLSNSNLFQKNIEEVINRINEERHRIQSVLD
ncbi:flagellar filament core protein flaB2 domain protein [Leptospira kanakyensis]|uniref:Flagellar filament core protein flaB2 domain protein n=1 Tax=Leptospira kanakyensis TaxID=2484968 RepID=A0A6N4QL34_9LEPT|nr:flagellar filament core protein flaB2 domain protein [Leptospira kanakyensis]MCW7482819.1 flagellar filament core protein flaB2 domain protein [Leptospira kanakyensis]TGK55516.1 flagellar filament core protein flaB2 domain protein [Leptospira kanakyensis]TGK61050.1 flagellar filament core protein flaB2 domain protein [Leptospira kanakyensis]TGK76478.1 flagellar filament core protein flaB2 domain protein [Leptospira kanakyensis]